MIMENEKNRVYWNSRKQVFIDYGVTYPKPKTLINRVNNEDCKEIKSNKVNEETK